eukprot:COSAG02_NODE_17032_length_1034_cov_0.715508_2_plen_47_part_01
MRDVRTQHSLSLRLNRCPHQRLDVGRHIASKNLSVESPLLGFAVMDL